MPYETQERVKKQSGGLFLGETLVGGFPLTFFHVCNFSIRACFFDTLKRRGKFLSVFVFRIGCLIKLLYKKFRPPFLKCRGSRGLPGPPAAYGIFRFYGRRRSKNTFCFFCALQYSSPPDWITVRRPFFHPRAGRRPACLPYRRSFLRPFLRTDRRPSPPR